MQRAHSQMVTRHMTDGKVSPDLRRWRRRVMRKQTQKRAHGAIRVDSSDGATIGNPAPIRLEGEGTVSTPMCGGPK